MLPKKKKRNRSDDFQPKTHWILGQSSEKTTPWSAEQSVLGFGCFSQLKSIVCGMAKTTSEKSRMTSQYFRSFVSFLHGFSLHFTDNCTKCCLQFLLFRVVFRCSMAALGSLWAMSLAFNPYQHGHTGSEKLRLPRSAGLSQPRKKHDWIKTVGARCLNQLTS